MACRWDSTDPCVRCGKKPMPGLKVSFRCSERGVLCLGCWLMVPPCGKHATCKGDQERGQLVCDYSPRCLCVKCILERPDEQEYEERARG